MNFYFDQYTPMNDTIEKLGIFAISGPPQRQCSTETVQTARLLAVAISNFVESYYLRRSAVICMADALKRHERVNAFNLVNEETFNTIACISIRYIRRSNSKLQFIHTLYKRRVPIPCALAGW